MVRIALAAALALTCAVPAFAHHGKDFLMIEGPELPDPKSVYFVSSEMFSRAITTEPSIFFGITDRLAGQLHVHFERPEGESLHYRAIAPAHSSGRPS